MSHKKDKRQIQSEKAIIEAGINVLMGNSSASFADIASAAGIGRATMYRHFETREALIQKIAKTCLEEVETALEPTEDLRGRIALETVIKVLVPLGDRFHFLTNLWSLVDQDEELEQINAQQISDLNLLIEGAKATGDISNKLPTIWVSAFFESTLYAAWVLIESGQIPIDDAIQFACYSFFKGCAN